MSLSEDRVLFVRHGLPRRYIFETYTAAKETRQLVSFKLIEIKYVEFKKCMLNVKLTVYYTVSFICNIHFLNSTYFTFNQLKE